MEEEDKEEVDEIEEEVDEVFESEMLASAAKDRVNLGMSSTKRLANGDADEEPLQSRVSRGARQDITSGFRRT